MGNLRENRPLWVFWTFLLFQINAFAQAGHEVTGVVTDAETGIPIPGVNVIEKGTTNGVVSDFDGVFNIRVAEDAVLEISYLGYATVEHAVQGQSQIEISLEPEASALEEVVIVGYGSQKRESLTGALETVDGDELRNVTTPSVENMLAGKAPGVFVAPGSGQPGSSKVWWPR